nr:GNAT family N-acetyltransferase [Paenibacillus sp. UNC451MF]
MGERIREACEGDIPALCELMKELGGEPISCEGMRNRLEMIGASLTDTIFVYEEDSEVLGLLVFRIRENIREVSRYGEVCILVVKSEAKRSGIGRKLMSFAEERALELGCKSTYLISGFGRKEEAHRFYLELGYEITGYRFIKPLL